MTFAVDWALKTNYISTVLVGLHGSDFYENGAFMLEEEGMVIAGLLVGLNVLDCNMCIKGEDLDQPVS